jgi:hypothetical protein
MKLAIRLTAALALFSSVAHAGPITSNQIKGTEPIGPTATEPTLPSTGERMVPGIMGLPGSGVQGMQPSKIDDLAPTARTPAGRVESSAPGFVAPAKQMDDRPLTRAEAAQSPTAPVVIVLPGTENITINPSTLPNMTNRTLPSDR